MKIILQLDVIFKPFSNSSNKKVLNDTDQDPLYAVDNSAQSYRKFFITLFGCAGALAGGAAASNQVIREILPAGYKIDTSFAVDDARQEYIDALSGINTDASDADTIPTKTPMLMLVRNKQKPIILDHTLLHPDGNDVSHHNIPNYFTKLSRENIDGYKKIFLATSMSFGGGSGSYHFFDFYKIDNHKLHLVKSFSHSRMERPYFAIYKNAIYDGRLHCSRGAKHNKAYLYTCFIEVKKYKYDGKTISAVGSEQMRRHQGNRFLNEKYWFISVRDALLKREIFADMQ